MGAVLSELRHNGQTFELNDLELDHIVQLVERWAAHEGIAHSDPWIQEDTRRSDMSAIIGLGSILWEIDIPEPVPANLFEKIKRLAEAGIPAFELAGALVRTMPDRTDEVVSC